MIDRADAVNLPIPAALGMVGLARGAREIGRSGGACRGRFNIAAAGVMLAPSCRRGRALETSLYLPVKRFLEDLGFAVKGEVGGCDLVALSGDAPPVLVIGELKLGFNLELVLQGVDRMAACDEVWLAVPASRRGRDRDRRVRKLCRLLGFGLMAVAGTGAIEILAAPGPYRPRADPRRRSRLAAEHRRRQGDPMLGGGVKQPVMTAYRQRALACASALAHGPRRTAELKATVPDAPKILVRNVYGWFVRVERGCYGLTDGGRAALERWPLASACLTSA